MVGLFLTSSKPSSPAWATWAAGACRAAQGSAEEQQETSDEPGQRTGEAPQEVQRGALIFLGVQHVSQPDPFRPPLKGNQKEWFGLELVETRG